MGHDKTTKITSWIAGIVAVMVSILGPFGYFALSYQYTVGTLDTEAAMTADAISQITGANPETWRFQEIRLQELMNRPSIEGHINDNDRKRIYDGEGRLVAEIASPILMPSVRRMHEIRDAGYVVGTLEVTRSLRPLMLQTIFIGLLASSLGFGIFIALRILPLRAIARAHQSLQQMNDFLKKVMESSTNAIAVIDQNGSVILVNRRTLEISGYPEEELIGKPVSILFSLEVFEVVLDHVSRIKNQEITESRFESEITSRNGKTINILCGAAPLYHEGEVTGMVLSAEDISDRKRAEKALKASEERYRMLVDNQSDLVVKMDGEGKFLFVSPSFCSLFGKTEQELLGRMFMSVIYPEDQPATIEAKEELTAHPHRCYYENRAITKNGLCWIGWSERAVFDAAGAVVAVVGIGRDITERKRAESEIEQLAYYDILTSLPNRLLLHDRLSQAVARAHRKSSMVGVMFLDLDRFKRINDTLGHFVGDRLLRTVASRLGGCVRETDTVSRLGGDEFVIVISDVDCVEKITVVAEKILSVLATPVQLDEQEVFPTVSIGISTFPADGDDVNSLLKNADIAMYQAKELGRNNFQFYSHDMNAKITERLMLETNLRHALEKNELFLVYQPQIELSTGNILGAEVLVRWQHPYLGLLYPEKFISLAEETGLILPLGEWVLRNACAQALAWQMTELHGIRVSVNISAPQFKQPRFVEAVADVLRETGLDPLLLEFEVTESIIMTDADKAVSILQRLKGMGISLAIDDFGTGYSSLSYLKYFPIDRLKIDRSFVQDLTNNSDDAAIAEAIIAMAKILNLKVTAEGVEYKEQLDFLTMRQCHEAQGYYISPPLIADEFVAFVKEQRSRLAV